MISTILFLAQQQAGQAQSGGLWYMQLLPFAFIFIIFYFLLIRPQQKRQKEHQNLLSNLKTGDKVVTSSGIHGLIANVKDTTFLVKIADNVKIEVDKNAIASVSKSVDQPKATAQLVPHTKQPAMNPTWTFFFGLLLLCIFAAYFLVEKEQTKRLLGTTLTVLLCAFCIYSFYPPGAKIHYGLDLQGGTSFLIRLV